MTHTWTIPLVENFQPIKHFLIRLRVLLIALRCVPSIPSFISYEEPYTSFDVHCNMLPAVYSSGPKRDYYFQNTGTSHGEESYSYGQVDSKASSDTRPPTGTHSLLPSFAGIPNNRWSRSEDIYSTCFLLQTTNKNVSR